MLIFIIIITTAVNTTIMAAVLDLPILSVNAGKMGQVDTSNVGNIAKIWSGKLGLVAHYATNHSG